LEAQVVSTAGVFRQVSEQLIPSLKSFSHLYPETHWKFLDKSIKRFNPRKRTWIDCYTGFATKDEHAFQGFHQDNDMPLLLIIDESQGVPDQIFKAAEDRCNPTYFLAAGSPGDPAGMFYDMETKLAPFYVHHKLRRVDCTKSKGWWIDDADIDRMIAKHGIDNPFVQSTIFAEFSEIVENALISLSEYDRGVENAPQPAGNDLHCVLDFAAGRDKNVVAMRKGNKVWIEKKWQEKNTMAAVGEFLFILNKFKREYGLEPWQVTGDADGLGIGMIHRLKEMGWPIYEFHNNAAPRFEDGYRNASAEVWAEAANKIKRGEIILPDDPELKAQVLGRKCKRNSSGKLELESKEDMKKRGLSSPDEADAVLGAMMPAYNTRSVSLVRPEERNAHAYEEEQGERRYFS
jgi:phage terminase large subunit